MVLPSVDGLLVGAEDGRQFVLGESKLFGHEHRFPDLFWARFRSVAFYDISEPPGDFFLLVHLTRISPWGLE